MWTTVSRECVNLTRASALWFPLDSLKMNGMQMAGHGRTAEPART